MRATWVGQPLEAFGGWTADTLAGVLSDPAIHEFRVSVAWMKRSGLSRFGGAVVDFRERGGRAEVIVGIDEGGATHQGLSDALEIFDDVRIFHDPERRTFHPKVYIAWGPEKTAIIVGSNNLTAGGLYSNYEASLLCEVDFSEDGDRSFVDLVKSWYEALRSDEEVCLPLTRKFLEQLASDARYRIGDEDSDRPAAQRDESETVTTDTPEASLFGRSQTGKKPGLPRPAREPGTSRTRGRRTRSVVRARPRPPRVTHTYIWWKRMSPSDAQQPPGATTAVTGQLKLTRSEFDFDHTQYFRQTMFADAVWAARPDTRGEREEAIVTFDVTIAGKSLGSIALKIDHADYRAANQGNVTTWLHWGPLGATLRAGNFKGWHAIVKKYDDGSYSLEVAEAAPA